MLPKMIIGDFAVHMGNQYYHELKDAFLLGVCKSVFGALLGYLQYVTLNYDKHIRIFTIQV